MINIFSLIPIIFYSVILFLIIKYLYGLILGKKKQIKQVEKFLDIYHSVAEVKEALVKSGLESSNLIIGIDFTASNHNQGRRSFHGRNLHSFSNEYDNPYQSVITIIGRTLADLDEDNLIPLFGFGDINTKNHSIFPMFPNDSTGRYCCGFEEALTVYQDIAPNVTLSGPTSFAPLIEKAISICEQTKPSQYHILLIITDGQVEGRDKAETINAIVKASYSVPLSIVIVGVGDGPFDDMENFDDEIAERQFDNVQFVNFSKVREQANGNSEKMDEAFALAALMEIPQQFNEMKRLKLL